MHKEVIRIDGMSCGHCVRAIKDALRRLPEVAVHEVTVGSATITCPAEQRKKVREAIANEGYTARIA